MDFKDGKERKERGASILDVVNSLNKESAFLTDVFVVVMDKDRVVDISYSCDDTTKLLGIIELGKQQFIEQIQE